MRQLINHAVVTATLLAALLLSFPAAAQTGRIEAGAFVGAFFGDSGAGVDDDTLFGLRAAVAVTRTSQLEVAVDRVETSFASPTLGPLDESFTSTAIHWVFNFPGQTSPLVPYVLIGVAEITDEVDSPAGTAKDDDIYFPWGGGFRAFLNPRVAVRVEARRKDFTTFLVDQESWELTVGVAFQLGAGAR